MVVLSVDGDLALIWGPSALSASFFVSYTLVHLLLPVKDKILVKSGRSVVRCSVVDLLKTAKKFFNMNPSMTFETILTNFGVEKSPFSFSALLHQALKKALQSVHTAAS